nr:immunoglobulin light chain junction region [Macaca mulatta]MOW00292.1 immunoglobulin light chain junction region [Macaca mulatta]MOW00428.1 immunoglobulin light chain junction region [Macaca mulatta]
DYFCQVFDADTRVF